MGKGGGREVSSTLTIVTRWIKTRLGFIFRQPSRVRVRGKIRREDLERHWHHLAIVKEKGQPLRIYFDGELADPLLSGYSGEFSLATWLADPVEEKAK